jgi:hypothetical protein
MAQPSSYVAPVQGAVRRLDQGIDYQGKPGDPVVAIGRARVDAVKSDPGGFGKAVYYTLLDGPMKGRQIYVGHAQPVVHVGEIVGAGDSVATLLTHGLGNAGNLSGWTEIGFANKGAPLAGSAKSFQQFVTNLSQSAAPGASSPPSAAPPQGSGAAVLPAQTPPPVGPGLAQPQAYDPGTIPADGPNPRLFAETWQRIAADPAAPPEAANFAQIWQTATTGG